MLELRRWIHRFKFHIFRNLFIFLRIKVTQLYIHNGSGSLYILIYVTNTLLHLFQI